MYHPKLKEDTSTPETDPNLFQVADLEEDYYLQNNPAKYAIKRAGDEEMMFKASDKEIDPSYEMCIRDSFCVSSPLQTLVAGRLPFYMHSVYG